MKTSTDGLVNVASGLGTNKSKRESNMWVYDLINNWQQLDACYQTNWIARQIVDVPAQDMTRDWRRIKCNDAEAIEELEQEINLKSTVEDAIAWSRLFGGAGLLMLTGQDLTKPLNVNKIKKGDLKRVLTFDRHEISGTTMNTYDVLAENYLQPDFYTVQGGNQTIHWSHFARFVGERLPRRQKAITQGWGDSVLRKCIEDIGDMVAAKGGIAELMQEANVDVINREGLADDLASDQDAEIIKRYEVFSQMKSVIHMALLDGDEEYDRKTLNLSGVAPILDIFMTWISGAARIPVTKLFGTSAKGMNATGEGDLTNYNDDIRAMQVSHLTRPMRTIDEVLVRSATGKWQNDYDYTWNPLDTPSILDTSQANLLTAQKSIIYRDAGIITSSQIMRELQAGEEYQFDDDEITAIEETEELGLFEGVTGSNEIINFDSSFNEIDIKRDKKGRFSESSSSSTSQSKTNNSASGKTQTASGETRSERINNAKEKGYNVEETYVHATNSSLNEISQNGNFPGVFSVGSDESWLVENYGNKKFEIAIKTEPWDSSVLSDNIFSNRDKVEGFISKEIDGEISDEAMDHFLDIASGESTEQTEETFDLLGSFDEGDFYKDAQSLQMKVAKLLGADAIFMDDEFGDSTVAILPGDGAMIIGEV